MNPEAFGPLRENRFFFTDGHYVFSDDEVLPDVVAHEQHEVAVGQGGQQIAMARGNRQTSFCIQIQRRRTLKHATPFGKGIDIIPTFTHFSPL